MPTILFDQIVYGPVHSRRLGVSLGINLSPADGKRCTFDCIYCECGLNADRKAHQRPPSREEVRLALFGKLLQLKTKGIVPERLTFSGNGEPTMHPDFAAIIDDTLEIRDEICPSAKVAVLSNSTMLQKTGVFSALSKIDEKLMKFDAATDELIKLIDQPLHTIIGKYEETWKNNNIDRKNNKPIHHHFIVRKLIDDLRLFNGKLTIQTLFLKGDYKGIAFDNTCDENVELWLDALKEIRPEKVMIYAINRETPVKTLHKIPFETLEKIAGKVRVAGFTVIVSA